MTIKPDALSVIFERLVCAESGAPVFFGADEVTQWADGALEVLLSAGVLSVAPPVMSLECHGCEHNCFMPVYVRPSEDGRPARAFISCDKPEDVGRVIVDLRRLQQWRVTAASLADALARLLGVSAPPVADGPGASWNLGCLKGRERLGAVVLSLTGSASLAVGETTLPLAHVLQFSPTGLYVDLEEVLRMAEAATEGRSDSAKPVPRQRAQEAIILRAILELGQNPKQLPAQPRGRPGIKSEAWKRVSRNAVFVTRGVFDAAWERLRKSGEVVNAAPPN